MASLFRGGQWLLAFKQALTGFSMRALPASVEAQFVIPFDTIKAVFDASKAKEAKK